MAQERSRRAVAADDVDSQHFSRLQSRLRTGLPRAAVQMSALAVPQMLARADGASGPAGQCQVSSCSLRASPPRRVLLRAAAPRLLRQRGAVRVAASKVGAPVRGPAQKAPRAACAFCAARCRALRSR
jgi:hypothetical protein